MSDVYGLPRVAEAPLGGGASTPTPTVTVLTPASSTSSSPSSGAVDITWSSAVGWGLSQTCYRVQVSDNVSSAVLVDTGLVAGGVESYTVSDWAMQVGSGVAVDITVWVGVGPVASATVGSATNTDITFNFGAPAVTLTGSQYSEAANIVVGWDFVDGLGYDQVAYRVTVANAQSLTVWDSGWVPSVVGSGGSDSVAVPVTLTSGLWDVEVTARNLFDAEASAAATWTVDVSESIAQAASLYDNVGVIAEVAVQGVPLMLFDGRDDKQQWRYQRRRVPLDAPRFSTGDTPFNQSFDRYTFLGQGEWDGGAGQTWGDRDDDDRSAFAQSWNVDPFTVDGGFKLLPGTVHRSAATAVRLEPLGDGLVVQTSPSAIEYTNDDSVWNSFAIGASASDFTSDGGAYWYAACGASGVYRGQAGPGSSWSSVELETIGFAGNRVLGGQRQGASVTPNELVTIAPNAGLEETLITFAEGTTVCCFVAGSGFVWFIAERGSWSAVYAWQVGSEDSPRQVAEMPAGEQAVELFHYQQQVFVRTESETGSTIWRAPYDQNGRLSLNALVELDGTSGRGFAAERGRVFFGWTAMGDADESGVGCVNLSTGGWCRWLHDDVASGDVLAVTHWDGKLRFVVAGHGLVSESAALSDDGWLLTSRLDGGGSTLGKIWDKVSVTCASLPAGCEVELLASYNQGVSFEQVGVLSATGIRSGEWTVDKTSKTLALRVNVSSSAGLGPTVHVLQTQFHPQQVSDQMLQLPVACFDTVAGLNEKPLPGQAGQKSAGAMLARLLESWSNELVLVQDVDWMPGDPGEVYELIGVESEKVSLYDDHRGGQQVGVVTMLGLRRPV